MDRIPMSHRHGQTPSASPSAFLSSPQDSECLPPLYAGLRRLVRPVLRHFFDFRVSGLEHLPAGGPFIVAANHANYLDGVVLGAALPRKIVFLVMPRVYHATPLHPYFHRHVGSIQIELARPDPGAIRRALRVLDDGGVVGIFPEGPFARDGCLVHGQPGVAQVALRAGVPVVPAAISGTFQALAARRWHIPRRVPLRVRFGRALRFSPLARRRLTQRLREDVTARIMAEIAALLADEPRLPAPLPTPAGGP
ncbi:MAG TPA: lysophospholipid acyltransferase family protein [Methylomirabilota bacterium]|nr:lysophospholipid acyltransferase family protein [Methylomirabilota bacterium]